MFCGTLWGAGMGSAQDHTEKEREPPARPISPEFPSYIPPATVSKLDASASSSIRDRICHIRSFSEISDEDLAQLNIKFNHNVPLSDLLSTDQFVERPFLFDEDLDAMLTEISASNQDAFREVLRMDPLPGRTKPRLAYARNFFSSLEDMARYWDSSLDKYYRVPVDKNQQSEPNGSSVSQPIKGPAKLSEEVVANANNDGSTDTEMPDVSSPNDEASTETKEVYKGYRYGNGEQLNPGTRVALVKNLLKMVTHKFACRDHEPMPSPREKLVIRGVKVQSVQYHFCVARIPKDSKLARARMVEGPIMAVHCREEVRFKQDPKLASAQSVLTGGDDSPPAVDGTSTTPTRPGNARSTLQGPPFLGEKFDLFREVGCMLILATQRSREGKSKDSYSGADRWWVTQKRWGGGPTKWGNLAMEVFEDEDPSWSPEEKRLQEQKRQDAANDRSKGKDANENGQSATADGSVDELMANNAPILRSIPGDPLSGPRKKKLRSLERPAGKEEEMRDGRRLMYVPPFKKKWYTEWQKLRPNTPLWDDKIMYQQIGKPAGSEFDEIYMITSVNHHVALLKMKVHPDYLAWLETGKPVPSEPLEDGSQRDVLDVQRSAWYDMFDIDARKEFLIALWRLMCWLNREHIDPAEFQKMEEKRKAQYSG